MPLFILDTLNTLSGMQSVDSQYLRSKLGKQYKLYMKGRGPCSKDIVGSNIKPMEFNDHVFTKQFIRTLQAPPNLWRKLVSTRIMSVLTHERDRDIEHKVSLLLISGKVCIYEISENAKVVSPKSQRISKNCGRISYEFAPASALLIEEFKPLKTFSNLRDITEFIDELDIDETELKEMMAQLNIPNAANAGYESLVKQLAEVINKGNIVAFVNKPINEIQLPETEVVISRPPSLGPEIPPAPAPAPVQEQPNAEAEQAAALIQASEEGVVFCEECEKAKAEAAM